MRGRRFKKTLLRMHSGIWRWSVEDFYSTILGSGTAKTHLGAEHAAMACERNHLAQCAALKQPGFSKR